jgi:hypothetical protein
MSVRGCPPNRQQPTATFRMMGRFLDGKFLNLFTREENCDGGRLAPRAGLEPATIRLTAERSTN